MTCKYLVHCRFPRDQIILWSHLPHEALLTLTKWVKSKDGNFCKSTLELLTLEATPLVWQYRLWSIQGRDTKLERFLHKNQHAQRKLLNFDNWTNGEPQ